MRKINSPDQWHLTTKTKPLPKTKQNKIPDSLAGRRLYTAEEIDKIASLDDQRFLLWISARVQSNLPKENLKQIIAIYKARKEKRANDK
jgi:hypothetical protein